MSDRLRLLGPLVALAAMAVMPFLVSAFTITLLNYVGIGAIVALGLVLMTGFGGLTSFGQAALVGIGAYATAFVTVNLGLSPLLGLALALVLTGAVAMLLGAITLRLGGHFLPLSTIAWGIAIYFLFPNIPGLGAHDGIRGIPPITIAGVSFAANSAIYYLIFAILAVAMWCVANLLDSREAARSARCAAGPPCWRASASSSSGSGCSSSCSRRCSQGWPAGSTRTCCGSSAPRPSISARASSTC